jgi:hypothetical protein
MNEGKKDRRDPIRTIKARNPVAKNATSAIGGGAAGAHKDKKKAMKQGEVKHKNAEYAEHLEKSLMSKLEEARTEIKDKEGKVISWKDEGEWKKSEKKNPRGKVTNLSDKARKETEKLQVAEQQYNKFRVGQRATFTSSRGQEFPVIITAVDYDDDAVKIKSAENKPFPNGELEWEVDPGWKFLTPDIQYNPNSLVKATSRAEEGFNPEYDDEAGMADNNLETLKRAVDGIDNVIQTGDNLPEWCQEKIAVAKSMLVAVWDYMLSEKDGEQAVAEASALEKFRKGAADREKKHDDIESKRQASAKQGKEDMKGAIDRLEKHVNAKEGWTHDSLAARLFETENTYEDKLANMLQKKLTK